MVRVGTKDPSQKEEQEIERNVRKSPTDKAPRPDKERRRIHVEDPDLDNQNKDLSMNYKDIGGSLVLAKWVAASYMNRVAIDFPTENQFKTYMEKHPGANPSNHTIKGESALEVVQKQKTPSKSPETSEKNSPSQSPQPSVSSEALARAKDMDVDALYEAAESGSPEEVAAAMEVIRQRKKPLPEGIQAPTEFTGELSSSSIDALKSQIKYWNAMDYSQNMLELQKDFYMARMVDNDKESDYFKAVMDVYENSAGAIRTVSLRDVKSVGELLGDIDANASAESMDPRKLQKRKQSWYQSAMFSPLNSVGDFAAKVEKELEKVNPETQRGVALKELDGILKDVRNRKMFDKNTTTDRLLSNIKEEESPALKDLDPGDFDFTDPGEVDDFVTKVQGLSTEDLARMVKNEPVYMMHFSFSPNDNPEDVYISDRQKNSFLDALRQDLSIRGTFEQVRFHDDETNQMFDKGSILEYRERALQELQERGIDLLNPRKKPKAITFWDTFMNWVDDMVAKTASAEQVAIHRGISSALSTVSSLHY